MDVQQHTYPTMPIPRRFSLDLGAPAWAMFIAALVQLLLGRIAESLGFWPRSGSTGLVGFLSSAGVFTTNFVGMMSFLLTAIGLIRLANDNQFSPLPLRIILVLFSPLYLPVVGVSIFRTLPVELIVAAFVAASISATFLAVITAVRPGPLGTRILIFCLGLTPILTAFEWITRHISIDATSAMASLPRYAYLVAELLFLASPFIALVALRRGELKRFILRPHLIGLVFTVVIMAVAVGVVSMVRDHDLLALVSFQALGLTLTLPGGPILYLVALFAGTYTVLSLIISTPRWPSAPGQRRTAFGLLCIWLAGLQPTHPYQFILMSAGFIYLGIAVCTPKSAPPAPEHQPII